MKSKRFYELLAERIQKIKEKLDSKGQEYSTEENKLHNFDRAAIRSDQLREKALLGMLLKHEVSVLDIIDGIEVGKLPTKEIVDEKFGDLINYYILLEACVVDRLDKEENESKATRSIYRGTIDTLPQ